MPRNYGAPFWRVTHSGGLFSAERWSIAVSVIGDGVSGQPTQAQADAARDAFQTTIVRPASGYGAIGGNATHGFTKIARIGADGLYGEANAVISNQALSGSAGTATGGPFPPQVSLAVTLLGASPRGAAGKGRIFLPAPGGTMGGDGRLAEAEAQRVADVVGRYINALNAALPGVVAIVGPETTTGRAPARQAVVGVKVGRVLDTVRSRRSSFPEEAKVSTVGITEQFGGGGGTF